MSVNHEINLAHKHMHAALRGAEHFISETLKPALTLKASQVCKCFAGSGPAPYRSDLWELGSPSLPPAARMALLAEEWRGGAKQGFFRNAQRSGTL